VTTAVIDRAGSNSALRSVLARDGFEGFYCYLTFGRSALDAGGRALLAEIEAVIARFHLFSKKRECLGAALYGTSDVLRIDAKGRVVLLEALKTHAESKNAVASAGLAKKFRSKLTEATEKVRALKKELQALAEAPEGPGGRE
jgi:MraZ protein